MTRFSPRQRPRVLMWMIFGGALVLASCTTLPDPSQTVQTLLVGEVVVEAKNFASNEGGGININGSRTDGVTLTLTNYQSKAVTVLKADKAGFFCSAALPAGDYLISKILLELSTVTARAGNLEQYIHHLHRSFGIREVRFAGRKGYQFGEDHLVCQRGRGFNSNARGTVRRCKKLALSSATKRRNGWPRTGYPARLLPTSISTSRFLR